MSPDKQRIKKLRKRRNIKRRTGDVVRHRLAGINKAVRVFNRRIRNLKSTPGERAVEYLEDFVGKTESPAGSNDAPFLAEWRKLLGLAWMRGQPWCGMACIAGWQFGGRKRLPDGTVYTPNICAGAPGPYGHKVRPEDARKGDLVVFNFGSGIAKHVGLARGPAKGGVIPTIEGNTSAGNSGSQANGGGVYKRTRSVGLVLCVVRP